MTRYCVNAVLTVDAWAYVDADTTEEALGQARSLPVRDFETGDPISVDVDGVEVDE